MGHGLYKQNLTEIGFPVIRYRDIYSSNFFINTHQHFADLESIKNKKYCECGDILIPNVNNTEETLGKSAAYLGKEKCLVGENLIVIKHNQNPKYLSYVLNSQICKLQIRSIYKRGTVFAMSIKQFKQIKIPLPPLEEQERIVSILDKFHTICGDIEEGIPKLIKDVTKQYEYYKDQIFPN